jgi:hypothetical protein
VNLKVEDYYPSGKRFLLRFKEKGGKEKELPVHHKLEELLGRIPESDESNIREDRPVVFLADCTPDMNRDRGTLKRQLEDRGFCVVPMRTFYHAPPNFAEEVRQLLAQSKLFIQIVGPFRYELTAAFPKGYEVWQLQQAHEVLGRRGRGH